MNFQKLKLPRGYISWTQYSTFVGSPKQYKRIYIDGEERPQSEYLSFGKKFAKALEEDKSDREDIRMMKEILPTYKKKEFKIETKLHGIPLLGYLDGWNGKSKPIGEYKTGLKWDQRKVDKHDQLLFYALLVWLKYGIVPKINVHWVETKKDEYKRLYLTGKFQNFKRKIRLSDIILFSGKVKKVALEINKLK